MKEEKFEEKVQNLNFTNEEKFKVEQVNELIEMIDALRRSWVNGR